MTRAASPMKTPLRRRLLGRGVWAFALGLLALNGWWAWGDWVPVDLKKVDGMLARGELAEAEEALGRHLRWSPGDGDARIKRARLLVKRGAQREGAEELRRVPLWWPNKVEAVFLESQAFKRVNRARDAEAAWAFLVADDPLHPVPPSMFHGSSKELIALYILEGRLDEARQVVWRAYDEANALERPGILVMRLREELERIDHKEAVAKLREYVEADPQDDEARRALALELHATREEAGADREIAACLRDHPNDPDNHRAWLEIVHARGDLDALRSAVQNLPSSADLDPKIWMYRGIARQLDDDRPGAFEAFSRAAALAPDDPEILYKLGMAERLLGKTADAQNHIARSRRLHEANGKLLQAYLDFVEQIRKTPTDVPAYHASIERLAGLCRDLGWKREAEAFERERSGR